MGEYAQFRRERIKIGTCENMYYLRADQADKVTAVMGSVDPLRPDHRKVIRFRFPWPDEDQTDPGQFQDYDRSFAVPGIGVPKDVQHYAVQFSARGYLLSLPCPEGTWPAGLPVPNRNVFAGAVHLVQQAYRGGVLAMVCKCGGCGARWWCTWEMAQPIIEACRATGESKAWSPTNDQRQWWETVADRIEAGYALAGQLATT